MRSFWIACVAFLATGCQTSLPVDTSEYSKVRESILSDETLLEEWLTRDPKRTVAAIEAVNSQYELILADELEKEAQQAEIEAREADFADPVEPLLDDYLFMRGSPSAAVVVVVYGDLACPHCKEALTNLDALRQEYDGQLGIYYKPLPVFEMSDRVAKYILAVRAKRGEGAAAAMAEKFMARPTAGAEFMFSRETPEDVLIANIEAAGYSLVELDDWVIDTGAEAKLDNASMEAYGFGFYSTPGIVINGVRLYGSYEVETYREIIERWLSSTPEG